MNRKDLKIAAVGDNCIDLYEAIDKAFPGGNPVNVSVYSVRMGASASYTGVVGTDSYGQLMRDSLNEKGVNIERLSVVEGSTAVTKIELVDGERILGDYEEGVLTDFKLSAEDIDFLGEHHMVVSGIWGMIEKDLPAIKAKNVPIAFDFATKWEHPIVETAIEWVDYAFFSSDESDGPKTRAFMQAMQARGPKIVVVTLGEEGSIAYDGVAFTKFGIVPCEVLDTMGAGDSYIAGFLIGILEGKPLIECMAMGAENSSVTLGYLGAW